jgi:hypothetical protein
MEHLSERHRQIAAKLGEIAKVQVTDVSLVSRCFDIIVSNGIGVNEFANQWEAWALNNKIKDPLPKVTDLLRFSDGMCLSALLRKVHMLLPFTDLAAKALLRTPKSENPKKKIAVPSAAGFDFLAEYTPTKQTPTGFDEFKVRPP